MDEIKEDIGKELRVTDRLTTQSSKLETVLRRFASLEENVIEMVRMDRNRESVRIETPTDVGTEIERIVAAAERRSIENREDSLVSEVDRREVARNPVSKFSACGPRENIGRKTTAEGRARIVTTPEVRLLGESQPKK
ncbi:uncharacterized protein LOC105735291 [Apis florea]|uniref:uncharacterized protein LOC105735291 n=1 Tax=Apis florea TaxID=7463 RepID=UPI0012FEE79D|nr:uncharacterized protein LOC105735291 [Apis florea]